MPKMGKYGNFAQKIGNNRNFIHIFIYNLMEITYFYIFILSPYTPTVIPIHQRLNTEIYIILKKSGCSRNLVMGHFIHLNFLIGFVNL